jgi:hypothetical protein
MNDRELADLFNNIVANNRPAELEFRLYYDAEGNPVTYTSEDLPGDYLVVDQDTYAQGRYDIRIIDEEIVPLSDFVSYNKMIPSEDGTACHTNNALLIEPESTAFWSTKTYTAD